MKVSIENKRVCIRHWNDHELIRINLSPEEAVKFATEIINKAYPLTRPRQEEFRSSFNQGCHRR